ncbi:MAG: type II toxin-antitoxin system VapC family toxin [Candidatus Binataceae bacterium]
MRLLLDTHVWVWMQGEPARLARRAASELEKPRNELWVSPLSVWELALLSERGRWRLREPLALWVEKAMHTIPIREAGFSREVALEAYGTLLKHGDPIDRLIVATARVFDLVLVTADRRLLEARPCRLLAAR